MRRLVPLALAAALIVGAVGCSSDDDGSASSTTDGAGATTVPPSIVPLTTTTAVDGTPVADSQIYAEAGLTPEQGQCIEASGVNGEFETQRGPSLLDAMVLISGDKMIAVPAEIRTGAELEELMLAALAADCAPADARKRLAAIDGGAIDESALADDLPVRLDERHANGATPAELTCLEQKFREAPARLSSLAANPALIESQCASPERLATWRRIAIAGGLKTAGVTDAERTCLVDAQSDLTLLGIAVDQVGSGDASAGLGDAKPACVTAERLMQLAVDVVAKGADFGVETLSGV